MDADSNLTKPVPYDIFNYMEEKKLYYGYVWIQQESSLCTKELWRVTREYAKMKGLFDKEFFRIWKENDAFYNNFEISRLDVWTSESYADYIDYIDRLGGIYYHRWADAPIKSLALAMLIERKKAHRFHDIGYNHGTYSSEWLKHIPQLL